MRKFIFPILLTLSGCAVLIALGTWQLQRLDWKEGILADLTARISAAPTALPDAPTKANDNYLPVTLSGTITGPELHVLTSGTAAGTGYRVITGFDAGGRRVMLDLGLLPLDIKDDPSQEFYTEVEGNLIWPDDVNDSTPAPDLGRNIWFGRDVQAMAAALDTDPVMIVVSAARPADTRTTLLPVGTGGIKNDHLEYAITWFGLALVWAVMGAALIRSTARKD